MDFSKIVQPLLKWYEKNARVLPWRDSPEPYRVWISEIMLQQTRVEAVIPYFERFVREVPDVRALAEIPDERLLKLWEGLGYYSRAWNLKKAAQVLMKEYGGVLPADAEELKKLPGIGEYTAGAVASIAYGLPEPAVDGNVLRVASRLAASTRDVTEPGVKRELRTSLRKVYPEGKAGAFTQALMELGATVCLPNGAPACEKCPLASQCEAHRAGRETDFPVKPPKPERRVEERTVFLLCCGEKTAVQKRPLHGLLAGLWEFPNVEGVLPQKEAEEYLRGFGLKACGMEKLPKAKHIFSHLEWHMTGYFVQVENPGGSFVWEPRTVLLRDYALPSAFRAYRKILQNFSGAPNISFQIRRQKHGIV